MKHGLGNKIISFKDREVNLELPVLVYRNLNSKNKQVLYSIKQKGKVVAHSTCLMLRDVNFIIQKAGQKRARAEKFKNVHAFAKGYITKKGGCGMTAEDCEKRKEQLPAIISYNPYKDNGFVCKNITSKSFEVKGAWHVVLNQFGVSAANTY